MTDFDKHDEPMDDLVRRALAREAEQVRPDPDGLYEIRRRIHTGDSGGRRPWLWTTVGAGVAAAAAVSVFALAARDPGSQNAEPPAVASAPGSTAVPSETAYATPTATPSSSAPRQRQSRSPADLPSADQGAGAVPVYWLGQTVGRPAGEQRLYRSFVQVKGDRALGAVATMATGRPDDPDYSSPWTGARPLSVVRRDGLITVDFGALPARQLDTSESGTAVQQLVYTVQGVLQTSEPVRVTLKGGPAGRLFGSADASVPFHRAAQTDVQAWIWITDPVQAATTRSPLTVSGVSSTFEATVNWRVRDLTTEKVVRDGFTNATAGTGMFGTFTFRVELPRGKYQLECLEYSAEDGHEANTDTKTIQVR